MLGNRQKKACTRAFLPKQRPKTIFSEFVCSRSNVALQLANSLDVCTMFQRGKCVRRCLVETRFHQAVVRLLSTKYHMSSSDVVWGGLNGNFQSFVRFHQNADHSGGKQGTQRARLVLGGGELHHTAAHYNTLQHTVTHCNSLQHTATHCNTLQHAAIHYHGSPCGVGSTSHIQNPDSLLNLCQSRASAKKGQGACK